MRFIITCNGLPVILAYNRETNRLTHVSFMQFIFNQSLNANYSCKFNHCLWISIDFNTKYKGSKTQRLILVISNH